MKYICEVLLDLPRDRVVELFDNTENLSKWQPGLQSFEHLHGDPGQPGAKSRMVFQEGRRRIEMVETITRRNLPDEFSGTYEAKGVKNWVVNRFVDESGKTRWIAEQEFQFTGIMKFIAPFMRGAFPKQTQKYLEQFKAFAESA